MRLSDKTKKAMEKAREEVRQRGIVKERAPRKAPVVHDDSETLQQSKSYYVDDPEQRCVYFHEGKYWGTKIIVLEDGTRLATPQIWTVEEWEKRKEGIAR